MRTVCWDLETSGRHRDCEILSIGYCDQDTSGEAFALPTGPIDPGAIEIHGLTYAKLVNLGAGTLKEALQKFLDFLGEERVQLVAHNGKSFDSRKLSTALLQVGLDLPSGVCGFVDTLIWARRVFKGQKNSLDALSSRFGVKIAREKHGAELDSLILWQVHQGLSKHQMPESAWETPPAWRSRCRPIHHFPSVIEGPSEEEPPPKLPRIVSPYFAEESLAA